jgi:hypothetical protein
VFAVAISISSLNQERANPSRNCDVDFHNGAIKEDPREGGEEGKRVREGLESKLVHQ